MALTFNSGHIIYYYMEAAWSVHFVQTYFTNPDYLEVQSWAHTTSLFLDNVYQMGSHVYHYVNFLLGRLGYTPLGAPWDYIMAKIDHSNAAMPFVITAFLASWIVFADQNHQVLVSIPELTECVLCLFTWLYFINEFICICIFLSLILFSLCIYLLWESGFLGYFCFSYCYFG